MLKTDDFIMIARRQFILASTAFLAGCGGSNGSSVQNPSAAQIASQTIAQTSILATMAIDVVAQIKSLQIASGPYTNGYLIAPNGMLNWYFANLGLLSIVQYLTPAELDIYILSYLALYLENLTASATIEDVEFGASTSDVTLVPSDSDDAYAGTFLSLAVRYLQVSQNWSWWAANQATLKSIANNNLVAMQKNIDGLTSVFQSPRNQSNSLGYLMDNCEVYRGLRDFASLLRTQGEGTAADTYDQVATGIAEGISSRLYDATAQGFIASDGDVEATTVFYPGTTCQIYPQAYGLSELSADYNSAWVYLNTWSPNWQNGQYDTFPWAILGYAAALRGQTAQAQTQKLMIESTFLSNRAAVTINELSFYQRMKNVLAGLPDI